MLDYYGRELICNEKTSQNFIHWILDFKEWYIEEKIKILTSIRRETETRYFRRRKMVNKNG